jgi:hypothetical protein
MLEAPETPITLTEEPSAGYAFTKKLASNESPETLLVNTSHCQTEEVFAGLNLRGLKLDWESWGPYMADYDLANGHINTENLTNADQIGLAIGQVIREIFPESRFVSLYDDYNTGLADSADTWGRPKASDESGNMARQLPVSDRARAQFEADMRQILSERGIANAENSKLIPESEKQADAQQLVDQLKAKGLIEEDGPEITFVNPAAENKSYQRITLRTKSGRWLCPALDASSFLDPENFKDIVHLVILPAQQFETQQDQVWEILRALDLQPENYHNIFFDENGDPAVIAAEIRDFFTTAKQDFQTKTLLPN